MKTAARKAFARSVSLTATTRQSISKTPWHTSVQGDTLPTVYSSLVPRYESRSFSQLSIRVDRWTDRYAEKIWNISARRAQNRIANYILPEDLERVAERLESTDSASIRFGREKKGRGYHGKRGDFCLIGAAIERRNLTLFYRSLELIGGLGYDLCIIQHLSKELGIEWKSITIHAAHANVFALKGNSNESFYPKLRKVLGI